MRKEIVVRKSKSQRIGIFIVFCLLLTLSIITMIAFFPIYQFGLLSLIGILPVLYLLLYYQTWQISFSSKGFIIKRLFRATRSYLYSQIVDGYIANSYTLHQYISLSFCDKKKLRFRIEDENASSALRLIQAHCSLRILKW